MFSGRDASLIRDVFVFDASFTGGVHVGAGDVNGDGYADLVVGAGAGGGDVLVLNAIDLSLLWTVTPYAGFTGGVFVAAGDVTGDGFADVVTGAGAGGGPHVRVFDGRTGVEARNFFAYEAGFTGGVRVAAGDVNDDGLADIITGSGPGRAPEARVFDGVTGVLLTNVLAYAPSFGGGLFVATAAPVNRMVIEAPADGATVHGPFQLTGWAFDEHPWSAGLDAIHVWAFPVAGGLPTFGGLATLRDPRPDVAAIYGGQYARAGFHVDIAGAAARRLRRRRLRAQPRQRHLQRPAGRPDHRDAIARRRQRLPSAVDALRIARLGDPRLAAGGVVLSVGERVASWRGDARHFRCPTGSPDHRDAIERRHDESEDRLIPSHLRAPGGVSPSWGFVRSR